MSILGPVNEVDRSVWQRRAVKVLSDILEVSWRRDLPALSWSFGPAGFLIGTCSDSHMTARRAAFIAWADFLEMHDWLAWDVNGVTHMSGNAIRPVTGKAGAPTCKVLLRADVDSLAVAAGV